MSLPKSTPRVFGSSGPFFLFLSFILLYNPAFAQPSGLAIQNYQLVSTTRAGRVLYDYTFKADIVNNGSTDVTGATATLINLVSTTTAIDDTLTFGNVPAGGTATSTDTFTIRVNRQYAFNQNDLVWNIILPVQDVPPIVTITSPVNLITVGSSPITVTGTVDDTSSILTVNGVGVPINPDGTYSVAGITLNEGGNTIVATAIDAANRVGTANIHVYLDSTPPYVTITYPVDGYTTTSPTITVTGSIVDIVKGEVNEANASVSVNGIPAPVSNKTFIAENLPLVEGPNIITAVGADQTGNTKTISVTVNLDLSALKTINMVSGNNQSGPISTALPNPLIVSLTNNGVPVPNETVIFKVTQNNGTLTGSGPATSLAVTTDLNGKAQVNFALGSTAGVGNNKVESSAVGFTGEVVFTASGLISLPHKINISAGNNQKGAVSTPLPKPLIAIVTDEGHNPVNGVPVKFTVVKGGGKFDGQSSIFEMTDSDGRATATLTLGPLEGLDNNVVEANFIDSTGAAAIFSASGLAVGDPGDTRISGVVLDNSNNPIPGVTMRVEGTTRQDVTDAQGQFLILNVPVGPLHLIADGSTATVPGEFPLLTFEIDTVAGQNNTLPGPIYLLPLNTSNTQLVGGNEDVVYTLDSIPGFELVIKANSVTFPDGSHEGYISVTQVHGDKVPMAPPNGQQPKFIITIQPPGAIFDPPAPITIPNVEALAPNEITNMYSFDHDLGQFVGIGTGTVSEDGLVIKSDPGVGVIKAGWHCGGNPQGTGCTHNCPVCQKCVNPPCECRPDDSQKPPQKAPDDCKKEVCQGGKVVSIDDDSQTPPGTPNTNCGAYADNSWWLPSAYVTNATCACITTPNSPTANCVRRFLQDRLSATPTWLKDTATAFKIYDYPAFSLLYTQYIAFVQTFLTPRIYQDHEDAYRSCCCPSGPAPYPSWIGVTTVPIQPCDLVGLAIEYFGSCHGTPGAW